MELCDLESKCLFCRDESSVLNRLKSCPQFLRWDENCVKSLQEYLGLDESFQTFISNAVYCSECISIVRDIEFSLKAIKSLERRLKNSRRRLKTLLQYNYDVIRTSGIPVDFNDANDSESKFNSYDHVVYLLCECLSIFNAEEESSISRSGKQSETIFNHRPEPGPTELKQADRSLITIVPLNRILNPDNLDKIITRTTRAGSKQASKITATKVIPETEKIENSDSESNHNQDLENSDSEFLPDADIYVDIFPKSKQYYSKKRKRMHSTQRNCEKSFDRESGTGTGRDKKSNTTRPKKVKKIKIPPVFPCSICLVTLHSKLNFRKHMTEHRHSEKKIAFRCPSCSKRFLQKEEEEYKTHVAIHQLKVSQNKNFECVIADCVKNFITHFDLKRHVLEEHEDSKSCDICGHVSN